MFFSGLTLQGMAIPLFHLALGWLCPLSISPNKENITGFYHFSIISYFITYYHHKKRIRLPYYSYFWYFTWCLWFAFKNALWNWQAALNANTQMIYNMDNQVWSKWVGKSSSNSPYCKWVQAKMLWIASLLSG